MIGEGKGESEGDSHSVKNMSRLLPRVLCHVAMGKVHLWPMPLL